MARGMLKKFSMRLTAGTTFSRVRFLTPDYFLFNLVAAIFAVSGLFPTDARAHSPECTDYLVHKIKVLNKSGPALASHIRGLEILRQTLEAYPVPGVRVELVTVDEKGQATYPIREGSTTIQRYLQRSEIPRADRQRAVDLFIDRRDQVRAALAKRFRLKSRRFFEVNLGEFGKLEVFEDEIREEGFGRFFFSIQTLSFRPDSGEMVINYPAYFENGRNPRLSNMAVVLRPDADHSVFAPVRTETRERRKRERAVVRESRYRNIQYQNEVERRRGETLDQFVGMETWQPVNSIAAPQSFLAWSAPPANDFDYAGTTPAVVDQIVEESRASEVQVVQREVDALQAYLSGVDRELSEKDRTRFRRNVAALFKLLEVPGTVKERLEAFYKFRTAAKADRYNFTPPEFFETWLVDLISWRPTAIALRPIPLPYSRSLSIQGYRTMEEVERDFDVLARKTAFTLDIVSEVDVAFSRAAKGFPDFRVRHKAGNVRVFLDNTQRVYGIGHQGALDFQGLRTHRSFPALNRHYAVILPKGFIGHFGGVVRDPRPINTEEFFRRFDRHDKLFPITFESSTREKGQAHIYMSWRDIEVNGQRMSLADYIRRYSLAVVEFDREGRIISTMSF